MNGEVVFREEYTHTVSVVNPENFMSDIIYRALPSQPSKRVRVVTKVSFLGNPSSQEFYLLAAVYQENTVYDPSTQSCLPSCPINSGYDARVYPMTCFSCNAAIGMVFSVREAACRCKEGTYFDAALLVCKSCGPNGASCDPASPTTSTDRATFVNVLIFRPPDVPSSTLRLELRFFESLSVKSLVAGQVY